MRKLVFVCAALLCFSGVVAAQNDSSAAAPPSVPAAGSSAGPTGSNPWQVDGNFVYQRFNINTNNANFYGVQSSVVRFVGNSGFGVEGGTSVTFGWLNQSKNIFQKMIFYGGGVHFQKRTGMIQPWAHVLVGGTYVRLSQTSPASPTYNAFGIEGGGGVDFALSPHFAFRVEGDYVGTYLNSAWQPTVAGAGGLVINF
jgi:hypothetical protein